MRSCFAVEEKKIQAYVDQGFLTKEEAQKCRRELGIDTDIQDHDAKAYEVRVPADLWAVCRDEGDSEDYDSYGKYMEVGR